MLVYLFSNFSLIAIHQNLEVFKSNPKIKQKSSSSSISNEDNDDDDDDENNNNNNNNKSV